jgi:hypothetical protein
MKTFGMIASLFMLSLLIVCISYPVMSADAKKVIIQNITLNVTVIIPITVVAQNAQICISLASSGDQTCQQIILDPTQTTLSPINVDLSEEAPLITSGITNQSGTSTSTPYNDTSSFAGNSNTTFDPGKSNITNPSSDPDIKSNGHGQTTDSHASEKEKAKENKDADEQEQEEPSQESNTENENPEEP